MKHLAESYAEAIIFHLEKAILSPSEFNREHRFVLPSQEADLTYQLGLLLEKFILSQEVSIDFIFKIGNALGKRWDAGKGVVIAVGAHWMLEMKKNVIILTI